MSTLANSLPDQMELLAKGQHMAERMLTLREVSDYLNVNPATVRRLVRTGQLRAIRVGRDMRFEVRVVDQWVAGGGSSSRAIGTRNQNRRRRRAQGDSSLSWANPPPVFGLFAEKLRHRRVESV